MATLFEWDGGALPTITGTTPTVSGGTMTFAAGSASNYASWTVNTNQFTLRWYVTVPTAWAASSWSMVYANQNATINARVNMSGSGAPGQVRFIRSGGSQIAATNSNAIALSSQYRIEVQIDRVNQTYRGAVFPLLTDMPLYDTGLLTAIDTGSSAFTSLQLGRPSSGVTVGDLGIGRIKAVDTVGSWIGRHASDIADDPYTIVEWDGGTLPAVTGATPALDGDNFMIIASGSTANYVSWPTATDTFAARFYLKTPVAAWGSLSSSIFTAVNNVGNADRINMAGSGAPGQMRYIAASNVQVAASANNMMAKGKTYRVELRVDRIAQTYRGAVFALGSDNPLYDTGPLTAIDSGSVTFYQFFLGRITDGVSIGDFALGRVKIRSVIDTWVGRHDDDPLLLPEVYGVWDGVTVQPVEVLGVWDGTVVESVEILDIT